MFTYRAFEAGEIELAGNAALGAGRHVVQVDFNYDGGGYAKGATVRLQIDGAATREGRLAVTPPKFFSINETFDVGVDMGSAAGRYPEETGPGYAFRGGRIERVDLQLR